MFEYSESAEVEFIGAAWRCELFGLDICGEKSSLGKAFVPIEVDDVLEERVEGLIGISATIGAFDKQCESDLSMNGFDLRYRLLMA